MMALLLKSKSNYFQYYLLKGTQVVKRQKFKDKVW
jgi:hypothetical protein